MRIIYFLPVLSLLLIACGGRTLNKNNVQDLIINIPGKILEKEDVDVVGVRQTGGAEAIVETKLRTAFRLEKVRGKWVVREVCLGHGQWEKISDLTQTLEAVKTAETRMMLDSIASAIQKYKDANGSLPAFKDYISLSDLLTPKFLTPLIRLDSWRQPLAADRRGSNSVVISSAGPDGKHGTRDDIRRTFPP